MSRINPINIRDLMLRKISAEQFLEKEQLLKDDLKGFIYDQLVQALIEKDGEQLEDAIYLVFYFDFYHKEIIPLLNTLISCDWHMQHENIAMLLQKFKSPSSVYSLYETINKKYEYLDYDDAYALAVKCIWALGDIDTITTKAMLKKLLDNNNSIIKENAQKQMNRLSN